MAAQLARPGVEVLQVFRTTSPSIVLPTLVPCIIGPAFQVVQPLSLDGTINDDALVDAPAILRSGDEPYLVDGLQLDVSVSGGPAQSFIFLDPSLAGLNGAQVAAQITAGVPAPAGFFARAVEDGDKFELLTTATGDGASLAVSSPPASTTGSTALAANTAFAAGIDDLLSLKVNGVAVLVTFVGSRTRAQVVSDINAAGAVFGFPAIASLVDDKLKLSGSRSIEVLVASTSLTLLFLTAILVETAVEVLGFGGNTFAQGISSYQQIRVEIPQGSFPDPKQNLDELDVLETEIEVFLALESRIFQVSEDSTFLRNQKRTKVLSKAAPFVFAAGSTLVLRLSGDAGTTTVSVALTGLTTVATVVSAINAAINTVRASNATASASNKYAVADPTKVRLQDEQFIDIDATSTAAALTGFFGAGGAASKTYVVNPVSTGAARTRKVRIPYEDFSVSPTAATITSLGIVQDADLNGKQITASFDGGPFKTVSFAGLVGASAAIANQAAQQFNDVFPGRAAAGGAGNEYLVLTSAKTGTDSQIRLAPSQANEDLAFSPDGEIASIVDETEYVLVKGLPNLPRVGDSLFVDGILIGNIVRISPDLITTDLELDNTVSTTFGGKSMYIRANNLIATSTPAPDLTIDLEGNAIVKHDIDRDIRGDTVFPQTMQLLIGYKALRLDLSPKSTNPGLLTVGDLSTLQEVLDPLDPTNPLGYGMFLAMLNSPVASITGLGLSSVSSTEPEGSLIAYAEAADFLEAQEIYALAPLTQADTIHQLFSAHVSAMSEPSQKGERVVLTNPKRPTRKLDKLVASGVDNGNGNPSDLYEFDTSTNLAPLFLSAGYDPLQPIIPVSDGLFLEITGTDTGGKRWAVKAVAGTKVSLYNAFTPGQNDDAFYTTDELPTPLIDATWVIKGRGADLTVGGALDKALLATTLQELGLSYKNRRVIFVYPDTCAATVDGLDQLLPGYYMCAAVAGMVGQQPPQQGFTNFPMVGFTRVIGSNDLFKAGELDTIAAGGVYIIVQDVPGGPLTCRHQLTTDTTSIETREFSITRAVDFTAKFIRTGLRAFIGIFNITGPFLDALGTVVQGQLAFLTSAGVILGGDLNNVLQDEDAPDTVLVDVTLEVAYPANYLRVTLVI